MKTDTKFLNVSITDTMCQSTTNLDYGPMDIFAMSDQKKIFIYDLFIYEKMYFLFIFRCLFTLIGFLMTSSTVYDLKTKGNSKCCLLEFQFEL